MINVEKKENKTRKTKEDSDILATRVKRLEVTRNVCFKKKRHQAEVQHTNSLPQ
jgi:hypothetical protein